MPSAVNEPAPGAIRTPSPQAIPLEPLNPHAFRFGPHDPPVTVGGCRLVDRLAVGGMGMVFRGMQDSLRRAVAVKVLNPSLAEDPIQRARFEREARATAAINHPNIIRCYAVGEDRGLWFIVYELVQGGDTEMVSSRMGGRLHWKQALNYIRDAAAGLDAIHAAGLVHRDIKPSNLLVVESGPEAGRVKLCDFGLAKGGDEQVRLTSSGLAIGTPSFMAPEQAQGDEVDGRFGDIYALGASLYFLITGRLPYDGTTAWAVLTQLIRDPFPDPRRDVPELPEPVVVLIRTATARLPTERHSTAAAFREDCDDILSDRPPRHARRPGFETGPHQALGAGKRVMVVDDDPVIGRLYQHRLSRDGLLVEVHHDGAVAWEQIQANPPDALVLDLVLPGLDGIEILKLVRAHPAYGRMPVVVFSNASFDTEIAAAWAAGADRVLAKAATWPRQLASELHKLLASTAAGIQRSTSRRGRTEHVPMAGELRRDFLAHAGTVLSRIQAALDGDGGKPAPPTLLGVARTIEPLAAGFGAAGLGRVGVLVAAVEGFARQLHQKPDSTSATAVPCLRAAVAAALAVAERLDDDAPPQDPAPLPVLVVDDDLVTRRTTAGVLTKVGLAAEEAGNGEQALALACAKVYPLVVTDLLMGGMNGFSLARRINELPAYRQQPAAVLFMTGLEDAGSFVQTGSGTHAAVLAKPFSPLELTTRALTLLITGPTGPLSPKTPAK